MVDSIGGDSIGGDNIDGMLLFGVNAVGKSSLMKSIGINIIMAQAGMYVASSHFTYKPYIIYLQEYAVMIIFMRD